MNINTIRNVVIAAAAFAVVGGLPSASASNTVATLQDSPEVTRLLGEAKTSARKLAVTADEFHGYTRSKLHWRTHAEKAHQVKNQVNAFGATMEKLEAMENEASPWQREAIQNMKPIAVKLAQNTTFVIQHINENPKWLTKAEYRDALANKLELASQLADAASDYASYGKTKTAFEQIGTKLELN